MPRKDSSSRTALRSTGMHRRRNEQAPLASFFDGSFVRSFSPHAGDGYQSTSDTARLSSSAHPAEGNPRLASGLPSTASSPDAMGGHSSLLQEVRQRILREFDEMQATRSLRGKPHRPSKLNLHRQRALQIAFGMDVRGVATGGGGELQSGGRDDNVCAGSSYTNDHDELIISSVEFSLVCPYSRLPMRCPVRSSDCRHLQCCELESWIVLMGKYRSLRDPKAPCPVCEQRVSASSLEVDFWMQSVLEQMPPSTHLVVLDIDGSYRSGDESREKRKEGMIMDVIDATQGDYDGHLSEVIDDDSDGDRSKDNYEKVELNRDSVPRMGDKCDRAVSPHVGEGPLAHCAVNAAAPYQGLQVVPTLVDSVIKTEAPLSLSETVSAATIEQPTGISQASSSDDNGVVVVRCVQGRALPSQLRLWAPHCVHCGVAFPNFQGSHIEVCRNCGYSAKEYRTLVRRFPDNPAVTMELTPDDTLILCGVDAIAAYLYRAGFHRYLRPQELLLITGASLPAAFPTPQRPMHSVWTSGTPLTRFELDFLEACCERVANGKGLEDVAGMMVPRLFRIPRQQRSPLGFLTQQARFEKKVIFSLQKQSSLTL